MKIEIRRNLVRVLAVVGLIWLIYFASIPLAVIGIDLLQWSLIPRSLQGLPGILTMPFLHDGLEHLLGNTVPLTVLLLILAFTRPAPWRTVACLIVLSGVFTWLAALSSPVVGASGLIYALTAYLMTGGLIERKPASAIAAVMVGVLYGSTLFWALLPTAGKHVAWDAHLLSAAAGAVFAWQSLKKHAVADIPPSQAPAVQSPPIASA
jgi:membrane associated rhomboid family serine protease